MDLNKDFDTLSEAMTYLHEQGFKHDFRAETEGIKVKVKDSAQEVIYQPDELQLMRIYRFEGMTNPSDSSELFALRSSDGIKGTLVSAYGAKSSQDPDMIRNIMKG